MTAYQIIDSAELAKRWCVPESWVRSYTRDRTPPEQRLPCIHFGRYVRFEWGSPALDRWLNGHRWITPEDKQQETQWRNERKTARRELRKVKQHLRKMVRS